MDNMMIKYLIFPCMLLPAIVSCSENGLQEEGHGYLSVRVYEDGSMNDVKIPNEKVPGLKSGGRDG